MELDIDSEALMENLESHTHLSNEVRMLKGMLAELEARVIHEP